MSPISLTRTMRSMLAATATLTLMTVVTTTTPALAASREQQQMMADLRMLQEQTQRLQLMLGTLADALKSVNTRLDEQATANRKAFADQKLLVDSVSGDLRVVRERVDDTNVRITSLSQEVEALRDAIPPPAAALPPLTALDPSQPAGAEPAPASAPPTPPPAAPSALGISPTRLYEQAWADYTAGHSKLAIDGFETFIRSFPKSETAQEAQYYIGEAYFYDANYDEAIKAYEKVFANYPRGGRVPDSYYKRGVAFVNLNQPDRAKESFETVIKTYPDSDASTLAKQRLDSLTRKQ